MRVTLKELDFVYTHQLFSGQLFFSLLLFFSSPVLFSTSCIGKKRLFEKAININNWSLAKDYIRKKINLSWVSCHCLAAIKANKA